MHPYGLMRLRSRRPAQRLFLGYVQLSASRVNVHEAQSQRAVCGPGRPCIPACLRIPLERVKR
ncbi:MAG: hypothetical protein NVS3B26_27640 [Mycobacteriales bacterium]